MRALTLTAVLSLCAGLVACDGAGDAGEGVKLVPDETVFIVSTLEGSPDTVYHHAQVYVGRVTDPVDRDYNLFADPELNPGRELFMPTFYAQVAMKVNNLHLKLYPDEAAEVSLRGPLGQPDERSVTLSHERRGVYGDLDRELPVRNGAEYRLNVRLADGRAYTATTRVPAPAEWAPPDTLHLLLELAEYGDGNGYYEYEPETPIIPYSPAPDAPLTIWQVSTTLDADRQNWNLGPGEHLAFEGRGTYVRQGISFSVVTHGAFPDLDNAFIRWTKDSTGPLLLRLPYHLRLRQMGPELAEYYEAEFRWVGTRDSRVEPWAQRMDRRFEAYRDRDQTYFPGISNILRAGPDGEALPKADSDAVGLFGGYSARYHRMLVVPERSWDPDSLGWYPEDS